MITSNSHPESRIDSTSSLTSSGNWISSMRSAVLTSVLLIGFSSISSARSSSSSSGSCHRYHVIAALTIRKLLDSTAGLASSIMLRSLGRLESFQSVLGETLDPELRVHQDAVFGETARLRKGDVGCGPHDIHMTIRSIVGLYHI